MKMVDVYILVCVFGHHPSTSYQQRVGLNQFGFSKFLLSDQLGNVSGLWAMWYLSFCSSRLSGTEAEWRSCVQVRRSYLNGLAWGLGPEFEFSGLHDRAH